jgi:hypothetical protein
MIQCVLIRAMKEGLRSRAWRRVYVPVHEGGFTGTLVPVLGSRAWFPSCPFLIQLTKNWKLIGCNEWVDSVNQCKQLKTSSPKKKPLPPPLLLLLLLNQNAKSSSTLKTTRTFTLHAPQDAPPNTTAWIVPQHLPHLTANTPQWSWTCATSANVAAEQSPTQSTTQPFASAASRDTGTTQRPQGKNVYCSSNIFFTTQNYTSFVLNLSWILFLFSLICNVIRTQWFTTLHCNGGCHTSFFITWAIPQFRTHSSIILYRGFQGFPGFTGFFQGF